MRTIYLFVVLAVFCGCNREGKREAASDTTSIVVHDTLLRSGGSGDSIKPTPQPDQTATVDESGWKTYRNDRYHFEFKYPPGLTVQPRFSTYDIMPRGWRALASEQEAGQPVAAVPIVHMTGRSSYPRFYDVEFRVGVSDSLATCRATNGERTLGAVVINGSTFNQFEFSDAAMMKYISGISYRTGHNGRCYAIEQIRSGSNYRDNSLPGDRSQKQLDEYYYLAGKIVRTFRFLDAK